jgi:hypothetical protein
METDALEARTDEPRLHGERAAVRSPFSSDSETTRGARVESGDGRPSNAVDAGKRTLTTLAVRLSIVACVGALSLPSGELLRLAFDPSFSPARRDALIADYGPFWIMAALVGTAISTTLGAKRVGGADRHWLGPRRGLFERVLWCVALGACLGFVTPTLQYVMGGNVSTELSPTLFASTATTITTLVGVFALAVQEEVALRAAVFEVVRRLYERCFGRVNSRRRWLGDAAATLAVLVVVGLTHMSERAGDGVLAQFGHALVPRMIPALVLIWTYQRRGLGEACCLHAAINLGALILVPVSSSSRS